MYISEIKNFILGQHILHLTMHATSTDKVFVKPLLVRDTESNQK